MSKIWIDLSDIEKWSGQHGGIQRVVYGITKEFHLDKNELKPEVGYISYSPKQEKFFEAQFEPVYERVETHKASLLVVNDSITSAEARLKEKIKRFVPIRIRENKRLRIAVKKVGKKALVVARGIHSKTGKFRKASAGEKREVKFSKNDVVLIMGNPWGDITFQKTLTKAKQDSNFKLVQILYDMVIPLYPHLHHPSLFVPYTQHMFEATSATDLFLSISESSAQDLSKFCNKLNLPKPKVSVIRLGDDIADEEIQQKAAKPDERIQKEFIACVGTLEIRKNHTLLYYAYKLAEQEGTKLPQLVIVGRKGWLSNDIQYLLKKDPALQENIILLDNISDAGLIWVYKKCLFTVYPSMYEGWGLPVAEALGYGKVCVASNTSSIPEIANGLIDYFSPFNPDECLRGITKYLNKKTLHDKESEIKIKYKPTSWGDTYKQAREGIENLLKSSVSGDE